MDTRTGEIHSGPSIESIIKKLNLTTADADKFLIPVEKSDMTARQSVEKRVSQFDHRTKLGILRNKRIKAIGRNNLCPCGSGKKFKKCCLSTT